MIAVDFDATEDYFEAGRRALRVAEHNFGADLDVPKQVYPYLARAGIYFLAAIADQVTALVDVASDLGVSAAVLAEQATERETP